MAPATSTDSPAPWRKVFLEHIQTMDTPIFTLGTLRRTAGASGQGDDLLPRARTCVFRGIWGELAVNPKNDAELNPAVYSSDLLTFTTDVRMDKLPELFGVVAPADANDGKPGNVGRGGGEELPWTGTGGGANVEATFWAGKTSTQWRIRGQTYVLAPDVDGDSDGAKATRDRIRGKMRREEASQAEDAEQWQFGKEITAHFGNLSPGMRGSFKNPPPGAPKTLPVEDGLKLGQSVTGLHDEIARKNFRVVVIVPFEVDQTDLSNPDECRRWVYTYLGDGRPDPKTPGREIIGQWQKVEVWP